MNGLVANNLLTDSIKNRGINIGPFTTSGDPIEGAQVQGNLILRGGSNGYGNKYPAIGAGTTGADTANTGIAVRGNGIVNPMFDGIDVGNVESLKLDNNTVNSPNLDNFNILSSAEGSASFICNTALNTHSGESAYANNASSSTFTVSGSCNVGFTVP